MDSAEGRGAGSVRAGAGTAGAGAAGGRCGARAGAWVEAAGRAERPVTGRRRAMGVGGVGCGGAATAGFAGALAGGASSGGAATFGFAGAFSAGLSSTLRTRSAIWSGTTLS